MITKEWSIGEYTICKYVKNDNNLDEPYVSYNVWIQDTRDNDKLVQVASFQNPDDLLTYIEKALVLI